MDAIRDLKPVLSDIVFEMEKDVPYAAALAMETKGERITVRTREQRAEPVHPQKGVVFTAFTGTSFVEASTNDIRPQSLKRTARELVSAAKDFLRYDGPGIEPGSRMDEDFLVPQEMDNATVPLACKIDLCRTYKDYLEASDRHITSASYQYLFLCQRELFVNRHRKLYQELPRAQAIAFVVMQDGDKAAQLHTGHSYQGGYEHAEMPMDRLNKLVHDCRRILSADRLQPGRYDCIFSPGFSGLFAHEAFGHGMEADMFLKKRAMGANCMNMPVASPLVNMFDSPALPGQAASFLFDHEGQLAGETRIIENGILKSALTDLNSAVRLKLRRTANGRRESFSHKAYARMTNTYFGPGGNTLEEMLGDISSGYLLRYPSNGMEDPKGWGIQLEGYYAEEIGNSRLTGKVFSPVIVTGYVPELLMSISMVGNQIEIDGLGMCGKGHKEWVKVTDGGPYLRLKARLA
ncbi:MAG: TldD/PmbA family protein [Pseudomonadota bacterium]